MHGYILHISQVITLVIVKYGYDPLAKLTTISRNVASACKADS